MNVATGLAPAEAAVSGLSTAPCLIVNPLSFRASRDGLAAQAIELARAQGAEVVQADRPQAFSAAIRSVLARRQRQVMVLAGDGTVHAIVEQLASLPAGAWVPDLLVLPGGRTNLTAVDLVGNGGALAVLTSALQRARGGRWDEAVVERTTLRVEHAPAPARHGFFFAGALVDSIIRRIHQHRTEGSGPLHSGPLSAPWGLLRLAWQASRGRPGMACPDLRIEAGDLGHLQGPTRLLLASTLLHSAGSFNPYAARAAGEVRVAAVALRAPGFWRSLPRLLTGRYSGSMIPANAYLSGRCSRLEIAGLRGYSLDGEKFDADPAHPVILTPGPRLRFLVP